MSALAHQTPHARAPGECRVNKFVKGSSEGKFRILVREESSTQKLILNSFLTAAMAVCLSFRGLFFRLSLFFWLSCAANFVLRAVDVHACQAIGQGPCVVLYGSPVCSFPHTWSLVHVLGTP